jgi:DNA gyrase subunit A
MVSKEGLAVRFAEDEVRSMGRPAGGVRGMNITGKGNEVLTMDVARDDQEVLVVTENGFGKRTAVSEYRKTSRGAKGVQTIKFSEKRGGLAAALVVRPHQELVFISQEGMVQRTSVRGIRQTGRAAQGVTLMNVRDDDRVSAVALVVESDGATAATVTDADVAAGPIELSADSGEAEGVVGGAGLTDGADEVVDFTDGAAGGEGADGRGPDGNGRDPDADIG